MQEEINKKIAEIDSLIGETKQLKDDLKHLKDQKQELDKNVDAKETIIANNQEIINDLDV